LQRVALFNSPKALTDELDSFVLAKVGSGRYENASEVVRLAKARHAAVTRQSFRDLSGDVARALVRAVSRLFSTLCDPVAVRENFGI